MEPTLVLDNAKVFLGSCLDVLPTLPDNSVDSIVSDPPYELGFMGKSWDASGIAYNVEVWKQCLRVLKPGGHLLAFGGSRTWHRLAVAIEDAGFEMRDSIAWIYGSGFPKSHNISKAIDKTLGANVKVGKAFKVAGEYGGRDLRDPETQGESRDEMRHSAITDDAKKWAGWGTALKPAFEPIVVARKPLVGTVAENVLQFGTGGINIDGTRIGTESVTINTFDNGAKPFGDAVGEPFTSRESVGRWPANVIFAHTEDCVQIGTSEEKYSINKLENWSGFGQVELPDFESSEQTVSNPVFECVDGCPVKLLDEQSGITKSPPTYTRKADGFGKTNYGIGEAAGKVSINFGDSGGASRFFYVAKANKKDRNEGVEKTNYHPTVKPTELMRYLVRLVTPPNGVVLDPFTGSGSTGKAALLQGFQFVGVELTEEYLPIIAGRLQFVADKVAQEKENDLFADL